MARRILPNGRGWLRTVDGQPSAEKGTMSVGTKRERWMSDMDPPRIEILIASEKMAKRAAALLESDDPSMLAAAAKLLDSASGGLDVCSRALLSDNWKLTMVPTEEPPRN